MGSASYAAILDARNRMTVVQELVGERQSPWLHLEYNARGERVMWRYDDSVILYGTGSYFLYDESGQLLNRFSPAWGNPDSGADKLRAGKTGQPAYFNETVWLDQTPVAQVQSTEGEVTLVHLIHSDHLNTPRALLNARTQGEQNAGTVVWRWKLNQQTPTGSNAFGALAAESDPDGNNVQVRFDLRFPGQQLDSETGLHYNYFRDYEAGTGRYVESDPIGLNGGVSTYGYVGGSPLMGTDPDGLIQRCLFGPYENGKCPSQPAFAPQPAKDCGCKKTQMECWQSCISYPYFVATAFVGGGTAGVAAGVGGSSGVSTATAAAANSAAVGLGAAVGAGSLGWGLGCYISCQNDPCNW